MPHSVLRLLIKHVLSRKLLLTIETPAFVSGRSSLFPFEDAFLDDSHGDQSLSSGLSSPTRCQNGERVERYSRKVFVGGLPPDIDEGTMHSLWLNKVQGCYLCDLTLPLLWKTALGLSCLSVRR